MKNESLDEFIARGGKITKLEPVKDEEKPTVNVKSTVSKPPNLMSLEDGEFYYGETEKTEKRAEKKRSKINMDILPEHIRKLFPKGE